MKRRFFAIILTLSLLLSLAACAEKTPTKYPENDFANLLTTDFWSMTESDLDAFLTARGYTQVQAASSRNPVYLGTLFGKDAYIYYKLGQDDLVEFLSANYGLYNAQNADVLNEKLAATPEGLWSELQVCVQDEDYISFLTNHTLNCREVLAAGGAKLMELARLELHGQTDTELRAFFDATLRDKLPLIQPEQRGDQVLPGFFNPQYDEYYYEFPDGTVGSIYSSMMINRQEQDGEIGVYLQSGLKIWAADMTVGFGPASQITDIADGWSSYAPK